MSELDCEVCFNPFNGDLNMPRILQCGHTLCSQCLNSILLDNPKACPNCRKDTLSDNINDYPVNYILLKIMDSAKRFSNAKENFIQKCREKLQKLQNDHMELKDFIQLQKVNIDLNLSLVESNEDQLSKLLDVCDPFDRSFENKIAEIVKKFETIRSQIHLNDSHLVTTVSLRSKDFKTTRPNAFLGELHKMIVVENKNVLALLRINGVLQGAKLSFKDDLLFINAFERSQEVDDNASTTVCDLNNILLRSGKAKAIFGFLDLFHHEGSLSRKVIIEIHKDTSNLVIQFLKLCTGELGISYKGREYVQKYDDIETFDWNAYLTDYIIQLHDINWNMKEVHNFSVYFTKKDIYRKLPSKDCCYLSLDLNGSFNIFCIQNACGALSVKNVVGTILDESKDFISTFKDASFRKVANCGIAVKF